MYLSTKVLKTFKEIVSQIDIIRFLYPKLSVEKYEAFLAEMIPHNYTQIAVFENDFCVGITSRWSATKLWTGRYLEIDNFVVHPEYRSKGIGKMLITYIEKKTIDLGCSNIVLDTFTARRFYYNIWL